MVIIGLILLLIALAVVAYMWFATAGMAPVDIDYGFLNVSLSPFWLFVAGGIALAAATSGLWMMAVGARSSARKAKEVRELRRQAKESERRAERSQDAAELDRTSSTRRAEPAAGTSTSGSTGRRDDAPILPRPGRDEGAGARGATDGRSDLDIDRPSR